MWHDKNTQSKYLFIVILAGRELATTHSKKLDEHTLSRKTFRNKENWLQ